MVKVPIAGGPGSIPGQGTRSHLPQLRVHMLKLRFPHTATKTRCSQINIFKKKNNFGWDEEKHKGQALEGAQSKGRERFLVLFFYGKNLHLFIAKKEEREGRTVEAEKGRTME